MCVPAGPHGRSVNVLCFKLFESCVSSALTFRRRAGESLPVRHDATNVSKVSLTDSYQAAVDRIVVCSLLFWCFHCLATWRPIGFSKVPSRLSRTLRLHAALTTRHGSRYRKAVGNGTRIPSTSGGLPGSHAIPRRAKATQQRGPRVFARIASPCFCGSQVHHNDVLRIAH
jgi:hypothetical protein